MKRILIIKHGSLGDIVFSLPVMDSIYSNFINEEIDLLTEKKYFNFLKKTKYFKNIIEDNRSSNIILCVKLLILLLKNKYDLIIDLQNSDRTSFYHLFFRLFGSSAISSSRNFAQFRYKIPEQGYEKSTNGLFNQIKLLKISKNLKNNLNWLQTPLDKKYGDRFVLFIPGVSKKAKYKQWDLEKFGELARYCESRAYNICVVGTKEDEKSISYIKKNCKNIINDINKSPPEIIYSIAKKSHLIITNDTGPGHIAALSETNMLWILNDNNISKANIEDNKKNFKILNKSVHSIATKEVIDYIKKNNLL